MKKLFALVLALGIAGAAVVMTTQALTSKSSPILADSSAQSPS